MDDAAQLARPGVGVEGVGQRALSSAPPMDAVGLRRRASRVRRRLIGESCSLRGLLDSETVRLLRVAVPRPRFRRLSGIEIPASLLLLAVSIVLPVVTFCVAFRVTHRVAPEIWQAKGYFLSAAIDVPPAAGVGSLGITISLAAFFCVAYVRHKIVSMRLCGTRLLLHRLSLTWAGLAAFGGNGVAAYPHHTSRLCHNGFAALCFFGALFHFALECLLEWLDGRLSTRRARAARTVLVVCAAVGCCTFVLHVVFEETLKRDLGIGKLLAAQMEWGAMFCYMLYLASYFTAFRLTKIHMSISFETATDGVPPTATASLPAPRVGGHRTVDAPFFGTSHSKQHSSLRRVNSEGSWLIPSR